MSEQKTLDIVQALSSPQNRNLFGGGWLGKILRRKLSLQLLLNGELNAEESFWSILPGRFRSQKTLLSNSNFAFPFLKRFFGDSQNFSPVDFFGCKLNYLPLGENNKKEINKYFSDLLFLVQEIAIADQYCGREFIKNNYTIIDAGANVGVFSLFAHHLSPRGDIYAFEPTPKIFAVLERNVTANNLSQNIHIINKALGDKDKRTMLMQSQEGLEGDNILVDSDSLKGRENIFMDSKEILMTTLDKFVQENDIRKVDFIKIDTEGYEKQIIKGAREVIRKFSPVIACSAYHLKNDKVEIPKLVLSINSKYDYRLENREERDLIFWPKNNL